MQKIEIEQENFIYIFIFIVPFIYLFTHAFTYLSIICTYSWL